MAINADPWAALLDRPGDPGCLDSVD